MLPSPSLSRQVRTAAVAAAALLVASGFGFRALDNYLQRPNGSVPLPAGALASLPLRLGMWQGQDAPIDDALRLATDTDDLVSRQYRRQPDGARASLYLAYGVRARDLTPHRPEVCYPGAGWTLEHTADTQLPVPNGSPLACRILRFAKGGFDQRRIVVVNYYIVDGQYCPDVSLLRSKAWRGSSGVRYMAQVQITASVDGLADARAAEATATAFATESAAAIRAVLPAAPDNATAQTALHPQVAGGAQ